MYKENETLSKLKIDEHALTRLRPKGSIHTSAAPSAQSSQDSPWTQSLAAPSAQSSHDSLWTQSLPRPMRVVTSSPNQVRVIKMVVGGGGVTEVRIVRWTDRPMDRPMLSIITAVSSIFLDYWSIG